MMKRYSTGRRIRAAAAAALAAFGMLLHGAPAHAAVTNCPPRDLPFSVDLALIDVLASSQAKAVIDRLQPDLVAKLPPGLISSTAPTLAAIASTRTLLDWFGTPDATAVATLDADLRKVPVTAADRAARCARYDDERPRLDLPKRGGKPAVLLFEKINGFRDGPSVEAAKTMIGVLAARNGWTVVVTDKGGVMNPADLAKFDAVIWNNISGDVLTFEQRRAFEDYIRGGGGFVGIHGSAGDPVTLWDWYVDTLIGARFIGHTASPQFQDAAIRIEANPAGIGASVAPGWTMKDEWYSFSASPRATSNVVATLDERTYNQQFGRGSIAMGDDHPIVWTRCIDNGRSFYSAIGHVPETYSDDHHRHLIEDGIRWAVGKGASTCRAGKPLARK